MKLDIITPVGPGHERIVARAIQSVNMARGCGTGPFEVVNHVIVEDLEGAAGRAAARNHGIRQSTADWLFFLDADDLMFPTAMKDFGDNLTYIDQKADAVWGNIAEYRDGLVLPRYQVPRIEALDHLLSIDPYYSLQMGFFVWRKSMPLFDETMDCGEDWKAYLELWRRRTAVKISPVFMVNDRSCHSTGRRSANGRQWREAVERLIQKEKERWTKCG